MKKTYLKGNKTCRVTFELNANGDIDTVALLGEFNDWDPKKNVMKRRKDGSYSTTVSLKSGREYRYRYLLNGENWVNDSQADKYLSNTFGTEDSIVII